MQAESSRCRVHHPATPPALPASWQHEHFKDASDFRESAFLARHLFNTFRETGLIVGALGKTDDLTPETD
jgi:hypothetical protein